MKTSAPTVGIFAYKGRPIRLSKTPLRTQMPAPCFGEDNSYIYGTLLVMIQEEIDELEREGVIGTVPVSTELQFTQVTNSVKITKAKHLHTNLSPKLEKTDRY